MTPLPPNRSKTIAALILTLLLGVALGVYSTRFAATPEIAESRPARTPPAQEEEAMAMPEPVVTQNLAPARAIPQPSEPQTDEARAARAMLDAFIEDQLTVPPVEGTGIEKIVRKDEPDAVVYEIEASGLKKDSLRIHVENGVVSLEGELENESVHSRFARSIPVAEGVDTEKPEARISGSALQIRFPRK